MTPPACISILFYQIPLNYIIQNRVSIASDGKKNPHFQFLHSNFSSITTIKIRHTKSKLHFHYNIQNNPSHLTNNHAFSTFNKTVGTSIPLQLLKFKSLHQGWLIHKRHSIPITTYKNKIKSSIINSQNTLSPPTTAI